MPCPFADAAVAVDIQIASCPHHAHYVPSSYHIPGDATIDIVVRDREHQATSQAAALLSDIGGGDRIREFCTRFYAHAFQNQTIKVFFYEDDGAVAHAQRLANWIIEKMDPNQKPWTASGRLGERQKSHSKAWASIRRPEQDRGKRGFALHDCIIWMRLHFWAFRECGLMAHAPFFRWYLQFIEHFIAVYEREAPPFAEGCAEWSASQTNIGAYIDAGFAMPDALAIRGRSMLQIIQQGIYIPQKPKKQAD